MVFSPHNIGKIQKLYFTLDIHIPIQYHAIFSIEGGAHIGILKCGLKIIYQDFKH